MGCKIEDKVIFIKLISDNSIINFNSKEFRSVLR